MNEFNEDEDRVLAAYQRQLVQMGRNEALKRAAEEGEAKGIVKGERNKAKSQAIKFYQMKYPNEDTRWLENLTEIQYDRILNSLFKNEDIIKIKKVIED